VTHRYRRQTGLFLSILFLGIGAADRGRCEQVPQDAITAPSKTWHEGRNWTYDPVWKDEEVRLISDLDQDGEEEVVIGYVGSYKPPREKKEGPRMFTIPKEEIPVIEHRVFYKVYDRDAGGHWECVRTLTGLEHPGEARAVTLADDGPPGLLIISGGGERYTSISLYRWQEGGYRLLDNMGVTQPFTVQEKGGRFYLEMTQAPAGDRCALVWDAEAKRLKKKCGPAADFENILENI